MTKAEETYNKIVDSNFVDQESYNKGVDIIEEYGKHMWNEALDWAAKHASHKIVEGLDYDDREKASRSFYYFEVKQDSILNAKRD